MSDKLAPALDADIQTLNSEAGELKYYVAGQGRPLLILHSINAAGSAYEIKPLFDRLQASYRVYAPDLPGFGLSERTDREYAVETYTAAIRAMLEAISEEQPDEAVHAVALSLSSEFLARVAANDAQRFASLALITPTGFSRGADDLRDPPGTTREIGILSAITRRRAIGRFLFNRLRRPAVIRYFLRKTFGSDNVDEGLAQYAEQTTQQPGAEYAPLAFLSGRLFSADIRNVYESLELPVWLAHGTRGDFGDFRESDWTESRGNWRKTSYTTGALPHFEHPERVVDDYRSFRQALD